VQLHGESIALKKVYVDYRDQPLGILAEREEKEMTDGRLTALL
jgi:hypothetical protein